ncbi:MAG: SIMPL domain-containing protein [Bryobacteraceae bacterium]
MRPFLALFVFILSGCISWAQTPPAAPLVKASGDATVNVAPDQATIDIGVMTQAATAQAAAAQNASQLQAAIDQLRNLLGKAADLKTVGYSLNPNYQAGKNGGPVTIGGYTASNTVELTLTDLSQVGKVIDAATRNGANRVQQLQYGLKDQRPAQTEALRQATGRARANAEAMAEALGLRLGKVIQVEQTGSMPIRPMMMAVSRAQMATPIDNPQSIPVSASVTLTMALQ